MMQFAMIAMAANAAGIISGVMVGAFLVFCWSVVMFELVITKARYTVNRKVRYIPKKNRGALERA